MLVAQFACRQPHKGKNPAWFEMDSDHTRLLIRVDHKILRVRTANHSASKRVTNARFASVINPDPVLAQVNHQFGSAGRHEALLGVWLCIAVVVPEHLDEVRE